MGDNKWTVTFLKMTSACRVLRIDPAYFFATSQRPTWAGPFPFLDIHFVSQIRLLFLSNQSLPRAIPITLCLSSQIISILVTILMNFSVSLFRLIRPIAGHFDRFWLSNRHWRIDVVVEFLPTMNHEKGIHLLFFCSLSIDQLQSLIMLNREETVDRPKNVAKGRPRSYSYDRAIAEGLPVNNRLPAGDPTPPPPPPPPVPQPRSRPADDDFYSVKWIDFNHEQLPILLQNVNGPCPLLAIANNLLLRKQVTNASRNDEPMSCSLPSRFASTLMPVLSVPIMWSPPLQITCSR